MTSTFTMRSTARERSICVETSSPCSISDPQSDEPDPQIPEHPYSLLAKTYRELSANAEENRDYLTANSFHYWSMEVMRKDKWRGFVPWKLRWWYWAVSGYSDRPVR